jgi:hypothetical protein
MNRIPFGPDEFKDDSGEINWEAVEEEASKLDPNQLLSNMEDTLEMLKIAKKYPKLSIDQIKALHSHWKATKSGQISGLPPNPLSSGQISPDLLSSKEIEPNLLGSGEPVEAVPQIPKIPKPNKFCLIPENTTDPVLQKLRAVLIMAAFPSGLN